MIHGEIHTFADDAFVACFAGTNHVGRQDEGGFLVEIGCEPFFGQFDAIAFDAREDDFEGIPIGADGLDLHRFAWWLWRADDGLGGEVEGDAEHVGVFDVEQPFLVEFVGLAAQRPADDLLAQELRAEGADAEHVGDSVGIPAFGEHGYRYHAADTATKLASLADRVHDFAQQRLVADVVAGTGVASAFDDFAAETLDFISGHVAKLVVQHIAGFKLFAIDQQGIGARQRIAGGFIEVAEQRQAAVFQGSGTIVVLAMKAGNEIVNELRDGGVLAYHDEARRYLDAGVLPEIEGLFIVTVEGLQCRLQPGWQLEWVEFLIGAATFLGHVLTDVLPEIAKHGQFITGNVLRHRHARQLDDAALDGVHQGEVAHRPGEQRAFRVTGTAQKKGRSGQVDDAQQTELAVHRFQAGNPQPGRFVVLLGFLLFVAFQVLVVDFFRFLAVAMMRLVIDDEDVLHAHQLGHDALEHLAFGFGGDDLIAGAALEQLSPAFGNIDALAQLEGVIVGDDDLGTAYVVQQVGRHQFPFPVVAVGIKRLKYTQAIPDGKTRGANQKAAGELLGSGATHRIDRLPGDQHGHHGRLARPGGQLEGQPHQFGVGILVGCCQVIEQKFAMFGTRRDFGQPDRRFCRLDLTEEWPDIIKFMMPPMLEKTRRFRSHLPLVRIRQRTPGIDVIAYLVDDRGRIVLLRFGG